MKQLITKHIKKMLLNNGYPKSLIKAVLDKQA